jgi:hypothetical protein
VKKFVVTTIGALALATIAHAASPSSIEEQLKCRQIAQERIRENADNARRAGMGFMQPTSIRTNFNSVDKQCYVFTSSFDNGNPRYGQRIFTSLANAVTGEELTMSIVEIADKNGQPLPQSITLICQIHGKPCALQALENTNRAYLEQ